MLHEDYKSDKKVKGRIEWTYVNDSDEKRF